MGLSGASSATSGVTTEAAAGTSAPNAVSMSMLRTALDTEQQLAAQLIESMPKAPAPGSGQHVDFYA